METRISLVTLSPRSPAPARGRSMAAPRASSSTRPANPREVAHNPFWTVDDEGNASLP